MSTISRFGRRHQTLPLTGGGPPPPPVPSTPANVTLDNIAETSIRVNWDAAVGATEYNVSIGPSGGPFVPATGSPVAAPTILLDVTGLTAGTDYCFVVSASNSSGTSPDSAEVCAPTLPALPANVAITNLAVTTLTIDWDGVTGATQYQVQLGPTGGPYVDVTGSPIIAPTTLVNVTGLTESTEYCTRLRAQNASGDSGWTTEVCATTSSNPGVRGISAEVEGTGDPTFVLPAGVVAGDLMIVTWIGADTLSGAGFADLIAQNSLKTYWKRAGAGETNPTLTKSAGTIGSGRLIVLKGIPGTGDGVDVSRVNGGETAGFNGGSQAWPTPGLTTTKTNDVVLLFAGRNGATNSLAGWLGVPVSNDGAITDFAIQSVDNYTTGRGGIWSGKKVTAGFFDYCRYPTPPTQFSISNAVNTICVAFKGSA